jgi:type IV pilus assembly protein PilM
MASPNSAWGIEIGAYAIKAVRLERDGDQVTVADFAFIPHKKVLSTPDLDQNEMVRLGLGQFISQKAIENETLVMSVPGHAAFARFAKLPPVEPKKVPDIVKFEAVQQIPFPIDEVEWDYQTFVSPDSPEVEVGIFAITRERVNQRLALYAELGVGPESLTLSPVALFNAMHFDHQLDQRKTPVIYLDIGTSATDLIVANGGNCWIRTFPLGGTHFTEAIASSFKLSYSKAEKLKQEASTSKYAKQIMQAMRPVFTDLLQDVQRSLGYYQSVHRDVELKTMVGIGSTFKIPGLRKFLGQQLQMDVVRLDEFRRIRVEGRDAASFAENAVNMATAYGLALQGVGLGRIDVNLMPVKVLRDHLWRGKIKWFAAAAAIAIVGGAATFLRPITDSAELRGEGPDLVRQVIAQGQQIQSQFREVVDRHNRAGYRGENLRRLLDFRTVWPHVVRDAGAALASSDPQPDLLSGDLERIMAIAPDERRLIELKRLNGEYIAPGADGKRYIDVSMQIEFSHEDPIGFIGSTVEKWLRDNAEPTGERAAVPYRILTDTVSSNMADLQALDSGEPQDVADASGGDRNQPTRPTTPTRPPSQPTRPSTPNIPNPGGGGGGDGRGQDIGDQPAPPPPPPGGGGGFNPGGGGSPPFPGGGGASPPIPGGGGGGGGGNTGQPIGPYTPPQPPRGGGSGGAPTEPEFGDLDTIAPVPTAPSLYPPNTRYFRTVVTFRLELLNPTFDQPAQSANAASAGQEDAS